MTMVVSSFTLSGQPAQSGGESVLPCLAHAKAKASDFEIELISTTNHDEAETFVVSKLRDCLAP